MAFVQDNKQIAFVSKSLSAAEQRYANIERELLAVVSIHLRSRDGRERSHIDDPAAKADFGTSKTSTNATLFATM